jgi:uncharacterized protein YacL
MQSLLDWITATSIARAVAQSATITAWLSAVHALGFTLITGSAVVANLRTLGWSLARTSIRDVVTPANRAIIAGLLISLVTGALLFSARAAEVAANRAFQLKMLLLILAALYQFTILRAVVAREPPTARPRVVATGATGLALWVGLAVTACVFILLE